MLAKLVPSFAPKSSNKGVPSSDAMFASRFKFSTAMSISSSSLTNLTIFSYICGRSLSACFLNFRNSRTLSRLVDLFIKSLKYSSFVSFLSASSYISCALLKYSFLPSFYFSLLFFSSSLSFAILAIFSITWFAFLFLTILPSVMILNWCFRILKTFLFLATQSSGPNYISCYFQFLSNWN